MKKHFQYILLAISLIVFAADILLKLGYAADDTFIYLRYASNLASGNGFAFNPGEYSFGVTSPLWVFILLIPFKLSLEPLLFAKLCDLFFAVLSILMFRRLTNQIFLDNRLYGVIALSVFILNVWFIRWTYTGMETSLAVCLLISVYYNYYKGNFKLTFFLSGLFFLVRPETFLLAIVLWLVKLITDIIYKRARYRNFFKYILLYFLPIAPFWLFAIFVFDSIIPNTAYGKSTMHFGTSVFFSQATEIFKTLAPSDIISLILSVVFTYFVFKRNVFHTYAPILVWIISVLALYIITDADIISRYLLIVSPLFPLIGIKGLELFNISYPEKKFLEAEILSVLFIIQSIAVFFILVKPHTDNFTEGINTCLKPIGSWLKDSTEINSKILVNDVGVIGYYSDRYIIDAAALINKDRKLNQKIMETPVEERINSVNLLKFIDCDYVVDRDKDKEKTVDNINGKKLELKLVREFKSLGISDTEPVYYKVYKITH